MGSLWVRDREPFLYSDSPRIRMFPGPAGASRQISPKTGQTFTGMAVETGKSFALGEVDSSANQVEREGDRRKLLRTARRSSFTKSLKIAREDIQQAPPNKADEMCRAMIVAVELFDKWAILFRHIDGCADAITISKSSRPRTILTSVRRCCVPLDSWHLLRRSHFARSVSRCSS